MPNYNVSKDCPRQAEPSLDDSLYERIEMEFAIPVYLTQEQQSRLHELFKEILENPANVPLDGVHWQNAHGPKPSWFHPEKIGPPDWDENTLYFGSTTGSGKEF